MRRVGGYRPAHSRVADVVDRLRYSIQQVPGVVLPAALAAGFVLTLVVQLTLFSKRGGIGHG